MQIITIEDVLDAAKLVHRGKSFEVNGIRTNKSDIIRLIATLGCTCSECGAEALFFSPIPTNSQYGTHTLGLYFGHTSKDGQLAYMTKDHILPQSKGGPNTKDNFRMMCNICNNKKGNKLDFTIIPTKLKAQARNITEPFSHDMQVLIYKSHIRLASILYYPTLKHSQWCAEAKSGICNKLKQAITPFNIHLFNKAWKIVSHEYLMEFNSLSKRNKQKKTNNCPGLYFASQNKNS